LFLLFEAQTTAIRITLPMLAKYMVLTFIMTAPTQVQATPSPSTH
jgi:hypothetical protein